MSKIKSIIAKEIKDSRGNPTVEVELALSDSRRVVASVPSGASTGKNEAIVVKVGEAIKNVNKIISPKLKGKDALNQKEIDEFMIKLDGTENKSKLGANAILPVSMAVCRAGAGAKKIPLYQYIASLAGVGHPLTIPFAMFNILEGGAHVHSENHLDIQEFIIVPQKKTFAENLVLCNKIFKNLSDNLTKTCGRNVLMGDEGGFAPEISKTEQALFFLKNAIGPDDCKIALDAAASQFFRTHSAGSGQAGKYNLENREFIKDELLEFYEGLVKSFPIISIEDPFAEEDWNGFESIVRQIGGKVLIIADDLTTTNIKRIKEAHNKSACNGVILKLNQIGTVSETINASNLVKSFNWKTIVSHRSGETMDDFIADLAVGLKADFLKAGSPAKEERMVKYSRLLEIEQELHK